MQGLHNIKLFSFSFPRPTSRPLPASSLPCGPNSAGDALGLFVVSPSSREHPVEVCLVFLLVLAPYPPLCCPVLSAPTTTTNSLKINSGRGCVAGATRECDSFQKLQIIIMMMMTMMHNELIKVRISSKPSIIMITMKWLFRSRRRINSALGDVNTHRQLSSEVLGGAGLLLLPSVCCCC